MSALPKTNFNGDPYMPIELKGVLLRYGIKQPDWAAAIKQEKGTPLSFAAASLILNWNTWPKKTTVESIRTQTEAWLLSQGVPAHELEKIWLQDGEDKFRYRPPEGVHIGQASGPRLEVVVPLIKPVEVEMLSPQAKKHFELFRDPFVDDVAAADDVFLDADQRYISEAMFQTAKHGGFIAVVGESGSGKSTLRKLLIERLRNQPVRLIFPQSLDKTRLNARAICTAIINDLSPGTVVPGSPEAQARRIQKILLESNQSDFNHVLVIEEAHDLSIQTIKHLKRFYEIEDGFRKLLSIILVGQPELKDKLNEHSYPEAREVIRRIEIAELPPLNGNLESYLALKFKRIGVDPAKVIDKDAYDAIRARLTKSKSGSREIYSFLYPLVVNNLITKALNRAAAIGAPSITADLVKEV